MNQDSESETPMADPWTDDAVFEAEVVATMDETDAFNARVRAENECRSKLFEHPIIKKDLTTPQNAASTFALVNKLASLIGATEETERQNEMENLMSEMNKSYALEMMEETEQEIAATESQLAELRKELAERRLATLDPKMGAIERLSERLKDVRELR